MKKTAIKTEPDFQTACGWWSELPNKWTPIGWRDHMHRFNVLWNGSVLATATPTGTKERTKAWEHEPALHLNIMPAKDAQPVTSWMPNISSRRVDDGMVRQGWLPDDVPVLWSEWVADGLVLRAEMFGHCAGGETRRGDEPLFAWIRLRIHRLCPAVPLESRYGFQLLIEDPWLGACMNLRHFEVQSGFHAHKRTLALEPAVPAAAAGCRVVETDGKVRLGVAPGKACTGLVFNPRDEKLACDRLFVELPVRAGAFVDVLLPMLSCDRATFDRELALGYDGARRDANRFWKRQLQTPTRFMTPDADVTDAVRQNVRFHLNLSERNPATGKYCKLTGSWVYADLWATGVAVDLSMLLDTLGHHEAVARYLEIFRDEQGTVAPPGDGYELHPGYLCTPKLYKSIDWLSDNGAVLWTMARYALLSGNTTFTECIVKSCDWIKVNRARTHHAGYKGVLPPAVATDAQTKIQAVFSIGWNYLGLCAAVQVLERLNHPRAAEFAAEAKAYREDYVKALRHKCKTMPTWTDAKGKKRRFVPTALVGDQPEESRHGFYLDTGPLFNVFAGLLPATDPLMQDTLAWFREGPQREFYRRDSNCWQVPVLDHEMSSCEPVYSWNIFHSWQLGDRAKFLEGMYSLFAGGLSQQTRVGCETRGGISAVISAGTAVYLARLAVIDDMLAANELHLLRLAPLAWLKPGDEGLYDQMPTIYGPVSLRTKVSKDGKTLDVTCAAEFRSAPKKVILHVPPMPGLKTVKVNGKKVTPKGGKVTLQES